MADPLAQYRKRPIAPMVPMTGEGDGYVAFGAKDHVRRLRIRRALAPTRAPSYRDLWDVVYDGHFGTNFVLVFAFMSVLVRGRNLQGVIAALESDTADFIQEFDPDRWKKPHEANAPFIESIEIMMADSVPGLAAMEKGVKPGGSSSKPH